MICEHFRVGGGKLFEMSLTDTTWPGTHSLVFLSMSRNPELICLGQPQTLKAEQEREGDCSPLENGS